MPDVRFEPSEDGFHGWITGELTLEKISLLQSTAREHFGEPPARWAVINLQEASTLDGIDRAEQEIQIDNVNRVARSVMLVRRDEFRLALVGAQRDVGEILALFAEARTAVGYALPGRDLQVERFDDAEEALAWARDGR